MKGPRYQVEPYRSHQDAEAEDWDVVDTNEHGGFSVCRCWTKSDAVMIAEALNKRLAEVEK